MNTHDNAHLTPKGREDMVRSVVDHGLSKAAAARRFNTTPKTVAKWVARFKAEGVVGLRDRSSKPLSSPSQTSPATADTIEALRRQRRTQQHIAGELGISKATVSRILKRRSLSLLSALEPQTPSSKRKGQQCRRFPAYGRSLLQKPRRHRRSRHDRQWQLLQILCLRHSLQTTPHQTHPHQALHPANQR